MHPSERTDSRKPEILVDEGTLSGRSDGPYYRSSPGSTEGCSRVNGYLGDTIRSHVSGPISFVFASEQYGIQLASDCLGQHSLQWIRHERSGFPVSATDIRTSPMRYWKYIPEPVRPYFLKRVQVISESDGFAHAVAQQFETLFVLPIRFSGRNTTTAR